MRLITLEEHFTTQKFQEIIGIGADAIDHQPYLNEQLLDLGAARIQRMDDAGIDLQILSFTGTGLYELPPNVGSEIAHDANLKIVEAMAAYPDRFGGFATLALQDPDQSAIELRHCVESLGFVGGMVFGTVRDQFLDNPRFDVLFETATALDAPIYLHGAPIPREVRGAYTDDILPPYNYLLANTGWGWHAEAALHVLRLMVSGLFDRHPSLKIILGNMGENLPYAIAQADSVLRRGGLHLERSPLEVFQQNFWITTSGHFSIPPLLCARDVLGCDRIMLSIDYPYSDLSHGSQMVKDLYGDFTNDQISGIAHRNAEALLRSRIQSLSQVL